MQTREGKETMKKRNWFLPLLVVAGAIIFMAGWVLYCIGEKKRCAQTRKQHVGK